MASEHAHRSSRAYEVVVIPDSVGDPQLVFFILFVAKGLRKYGWRVCVFGRNIATHG